MEIVDIVGVRPNFIKIAPLMKEMKARQGITPALVHTGLHYDVKMAMQFFKTWALLSPTSLWLWSLGRMRFNLQKS